MAADPVMGPDTSNLRDSVEEHMLAQSWEDPPRALGSSRCRGGGSDACACAAVLLLWWGGTARARDPREHRFFGGREGVGEASWEESTDGRGLGFTSGPRWADSVAKEQGFA